MKIRTMSPIVAQHVSKVPWYERIPFIEKFKWTMRDIRAWIRGVIYRRHHLVNMKALNRGQWYDSDTRIFEANFQILVDYVEKECAWMHAIAVSKAGWRHHWYRKRHVREMALAHLDWEIQLGNDYPDQSEAARKVKELYLWYKDERPNRTDPWIDVPDRDWETEPSEHGAYRLVTPEDSEYSEALQAAAEKEQSQYNEDTEKVAEIVKMRQFLWT